MRQQAIQRQSEWEETKTSKKNQQFALHTAEFPGLPEPVIKAKQKKKNNKGRVIVPLANSVSMSNINNNAYENPFPNELDALI
jgi:hypothetical protein